MSEDDEFAKLSAEDRAKLALLEQEFARDGDIAIERFMKNDPVAMFRIAECLNPKAMRDSLENVVIDKGLTDADIQAMLESALRETQALASPSRCHLRAPWRAELMANIKSGGSPSVRGVDYLQACVPLLRKALRDRSPAQKAE